MSKFADFIKTQKIDTRRLLATSQRLEQLQPEDRSIRLKRRTAKGQDAPKAAKPAEGEEAPAAPAKPRSGRPITPRALASATAGKPISGPQKTRMLRAINHILEQKKQAAVDLRALF